VTLSDGTVLASPRTEARGDPEDPLSDAELLAKAEASLVPRIGRARHDALRADIAGIEAAPAARRIVETLLSPLA
ncbi:MAG: MmgE/PrpD family protein, partial [Alphaproteobacteria bacterium]